MIVKEETFLGKMLYRVLPYIITFMHFTILLIGTFKFTFATIFDIIFLAAFLANGFKIRSKHLVVMLIFLAYPLMIILFFTKASNLGDFLNSYFLYMNLVMMMVVAFNIQVITQSMWKSMRIFINLGVFVAGFSILQYVTMNYLHTTILLNPYGPFSPPGPGGTVYNVFSLADVKRPNTLFSEPSINGWYLSMIVALSFFYSIYNNSFKYLVIAGFVSGACALTFSASAQINLVVIYLLLFMYKYRKNIFVTILAILAIVVVVFGSNLLQTGDNTYLGSRINQYDDQGTSSYFRVIAPSLLISESLGDYPMGYPLGDVDYIAQKPYMVNWQNGSQTNIDNSFFYFIFYFGLGGVLVIILLHIWVIRSGGFKLPGLIFYTLLLSLSETGALWAPETVLFSLYAICVYRFALLNLEFGRKKKKKPVKVAAVRQNNLSFAR